MLPILFILGCASTSDKQTNSCELTANRPTVFTGNASECTCEAQGVMYSYGNRVNTKGIIEINYSSDNEMHAQSCQKAILSLNKGIKVNLMPQNGSNIYGYNFPMSSYVW